MPSPMWVMRASTTDEPRVTTESRLSVGSIDWSSTLNTHQREPASAWSMVALDGAVLLAQITPHDRMAVPDLARDTTLEELT